MPSFSFVPSLRTDKSFNVGLVVVILFAVAEFFAASVHYLGRRRPAQTAVAAPRAMPAPLPSAAPSAPPVALAVASPIAALTPATSTVSVADRLRKQAEAARESGDTVSALTRLQDASQRDPRNAEVLAEMAMIYESIQNFDRSADTWHRVQQIGPSAGPLYELADMKLKTGVPTSTSASAPEPTAVARLDVTAPRGSVEGIPTGSTLGITEVTASETPDPDSETNLMLRIAVKKRPNAVIDHTKVKIQVYFYDTAGDEIKLTDADVSYEWLTPNHDWADSN